MQFQQLITILGLGLSHVHAQSGAEMIGQLVDLITTPEKVIANLPEKEKLLIEPGEDPALYERQIHQGLNEALTSLRDVGDQHTSLIFGSIAGYRNTIGSTASEKVRADRLKIYRDSMYSRITDLAKAYPDTSEAHLRAAYKQMFLKAQEYLLKRHSQSHPPMGDPEKIKQQEEQLKHIMEHFTALHGEEINKLVQFNRNHLPSHFNLPEPQYFSVQEINDALKATNGPGHPDAQLVEAIHPTPAEPAHPPVTPGSQQDVHVRPPRRLVGQTAPSAPTIPAAA